MLQKQAISNAMTIAQILNLSANKTESNRFHNENRKLTPDTGLRSLLDPLGKMTNCCSKLLVT